MPKSRIQDYLERFSNQMIRFNPYTTKKMGLLQSQTLLKVEDYMLICAPYQMSMNKVILLVILSREEITFFQQFQKKITSLSLTFQKHGTKVPMNLFLRGTLERLGPVKGRANVCMLEIAYKNCPTDLIEIIGDFIVAYQSLKSQYETFKDRSVEMNHESAQVMRFNDYAELLVGAQKIEVKLTSLSVNRLVLEAPDSAQGLADGQKLVVKLYFQIYQFAAGGEVTRQEEAGPGTKRIHLVIDFAPELVEILDDYFFRMSFKRE